MDALVHLAADLALWAILLAILRRALSTQTFLLFAAGTLVFLAFSPIAPRPVGIPLLASLPAAAAPGAGWELLGWPYFRSWIVVLIWLPSVVLALSPRRREYRLLLAACAFIAAFIVAASGRFATATLPFTTEALFAALVLNAACAVAGGRFGGCLYAAVFGIALLDPAPRHVPTLSGPQADAAAPAEAHSGDFAGPWTAPAGALLQVRIQGRLAPSEAALYLLTPSGRRIDPLQRTAEAAPPFWRRVNFPAPAEPYRFVARVAPGNPLRYTYPQSIPRLVWLAGKLLATWPLWLTAAGIIAVIAALTLTWTVPRAPWLPYVALIAYGVFFSRHIDSTAGPNDSGGYLNSAKLIAHGSVTAAPRLPVPASDLAAYGGDLNAFAATTFQPTTDGRLAPAYPVGFPLLVAGAAQLLPWRLAVPALILLELLAGVILTYLLARAAALPPAWAAVAAGLIGLSAVYLFQALQPQSDGPALVWVTLAMLCAFRGYPAAAGLAFAMAVLIRPSDSLALAPLALCFARPGGLRPFLRFILAGLPGAAFLAWYNHRLFGHALTTGYGDAARVGAGFGLRFIPLTLRSYLRWLPDYFTPVVLLAPVAPFLRAIAGRTRLILAVWVMVFAAFYAAYWCTYDNWYNLRFLLPAAPALVILGLLAAHAAAARGKVPAPMLAAAAAALLAVAIAGSARERVTYWMGANRLHAMGATWVARHLPPNAVVMAKAATGSLMYYTDLPFVRTDSAPARSEAFYARLGREGRPVFAVTYHWEQPGFRWGHGNGTGYPPVPGHWIQRAELGDQQIFVWERSP